MSARRRAAGRLQTGILPGVSVPPFSPQPEITAPQKTRVLLLCGGQSGEHAVSLMSAQSVLAALPASHFEVTPLVIDAAGRWLGRADTARVLGGAQDSAAPVSSELRPYEVAGFDVIWPLLHGPNGEDGTVQGFLTLTGAAYVGSGVLGSAASMDKVMTKQVLASVGVPQVEYRLVTRQAWRSAPESVRIAAGSLGYPQFVKPANLGSSVGISRAAGPEDLEAALDLAFSLDRRVILEAAASHKPRELEVGILGNDAPQASPVGELRFEALFYDYTTKYTEGQASMHIPAPVPAEVAIRVRELALTAFKALDCAGLARIDFFYVEETGELYLNEVNTMPGFTTTSMYPKLWEAAGLSYAELVTRLVELAQEER
ncbi:D-alanine--D-alanine ligase [Deinococcus psychrotolerans]|uniref:D-alanine--D-alanine ligase n=2 Tax=Deinococcus psychrotolerans TaxID=2489213 RepID=A0A3G8YBI3_9DEIO|nr:D-alanine--D-alanine ligase [Deinococcus psychrotolerans]